LPSVAGVPTDIVVATLSVSKRVRRVAARVVALSTGPRRPLRSSIAIPTELVRAVKCGPRRLRWPLLKRANRESGIPALAIALHMQTSDPARQRTKKRQRAGASDVMRKRSFLSVSRGCVHWVTLSS
jgi:hypothetical protein